MPALVVLLALLTVQPVGVSAEQASQPGSPAAAGIDAGNSHSCALLGGGAVRCWGFNGDGQLGYGNRETIGDNEALGAVGPVALGAGRTATALSAGSFHTCAVLGDATVRCWGSASVGQLGYGTTTNVGDNETPASAGTVDVGPGRTARAISGGLGHTCAVLDDSAVRCWGYGGNGRLGYANILNIGDDETPGSVGPVDLGGHTAKTIAAGGSHTCALLDDDTVRCWGANGAGQLGYASTKQVGDDETPGSVAPVDLGPGRTAKAISAGEDYTCAILDNASVRCWGVGSDGQLGYASTTSIGDNETPGSVAPVDLGSGRSAKAISAGEHHTCALLDNGTVRCWGFGGSGELGYGNFNSVGDNETPGSVAPVDLGGGRGAVAITAGARHTCARLDDGSVRCWGYAGNGRLGYCNQQNIGDNESPGSAGPLAFTAPAGGGCGGGLGVIVRPRLTSGRASVVDPLTEALRAQAGRLDGLHSCLSRAARHVRREIRRARRLTGAGRLRMEHHARRHKRQLRRRCLRRFGRTPGRVMGLRVRAVASRKLVLTFDSSGTDGSRPPAARGYLVKQLRRPIRGVRAFRRGQTLCRGNCHFPGVTRVGAELNLAVTRLRPHTVYYYAVAARDNVSHRAGPRSRTVVALTP